MNARVKYVATGYRLTKLEICIDYFPNIADKYT